MIEGIKLQLSTEEIRKTVQERIEYHQRKADWAKTEAKRLQPDQDDLDDEAESIGKYTNSTNNPVVSLKQTAKHHRDRATYFRFIEAHLVPNEIYVLTEEDLRRLEVLSNRY
jgi:hypothetical protein